jgi:hypothetical protein
MFRRVMTWAFWLCLILFLTLTESADLSFNVALGALCLLFGWAAGVTHDIEE